MTGRRQVAEAAGVSLRTVSNVVSGDVRVAPETRARVEKAIAELDYRPSELARQLKSGRSGLLGLVLPALDTAYFAELTRSFVEEGARRGITVVVDQTDGDLERERYLIDRTDRGSLFDALVISPLALRPADLDDVHADRPLVFLGEQRFPRFDHVMIDNRAAVLDVVQHLAGAGRRRIAVIGARTGGHVPVIRLSAFRTAMEAVGLEVDEELIAYVGPYRREEGAKGMTALLAASSSLPDAVFCFSDALALGALRTLLSRGIRVPDDVALVGFDDIEDGAWATPSLTTVSPDKRFLAGAALDRIAAKLDGDTAPARLTIAPHRLVVRESG